MAPVPLQMAIFPGSVLLFGLLFWLVPAVAVYVHASNRNRDALLWAVVTLVAGLLGVLVYILLAGGGAGALTQRQDTVECPDCAQRQREANECCTDCGAHLWVDCRQCGHRNAPSNRYCPDCGTEAGGREQSEV